MTARDRIPEIPDGRFPPEDRQVAHLRVPPHSPEAERSVLGALLIDPTAFDRIGDLLAEGDFYRHEHRLIFGAIAALALANRPADSVTVFDHLQSMGKADEVGGLAYLGDLSNVVPSAGSARRYAEIVREKSILRALLAASDEIGTAAFNPRGSIEDVLEGAVTRLMAIEGGVREDDWESIGDGLVGVLQHIQDVAEGTAKDDVISLGLTGLDERLDGGGRPGEVIVIGARPSMGKSALGLTIGVATAENGEPTAVWTGEMPKRQMHTRALSMRSNVHLSRLRRAERLRDFDWPGITRGVEDLRRLPLHVSDTPGLTINRLRSKARAVKRKSGLRVLVVDHLGLMEPLDPKVPRAQQVGEITRGLKRMAKELGIVVILLVQLNREAAKRVDPTPILSDLRESGDIEQDADVVLFVHRPIYYKPDLGPEWKHYAKLVVAKLRDGSPGNVDVMFIGENTRFMDWPADQEVPSSQVRIKQPSGGSSL